MERVLSVNDQQIMISSFLEIVELQTTETARQFLQATNWKLEEAIHLFFSSDEGSVGPQLPSSHNPPSENVDEVLSPLSVRRETLYDDSMLSNAFCNFEDEMRHPVKIWESTTTKSSGNNLASLFRPPVHLIFNGSFYEAKTVASTEHKWLLVNIQSTKEFSSHMLNRDTWANEAISEIISTNFIFLQVHHDTTEGRKVCTYYKLDSVPVVLVIDPITGQKMRIWSRMIQPESLLEGLLPFLDAGPKNPHRNTLSHKPPRGSCSSAPKIKGSERNEEDEIVLLSSSRYPPLPEQPNKVDDKKLLCIVGVRLPDGRRVQRNFLRTDPIQLLWSFCSSFLKEEDVMKKFRLALPIPGASKVLDYKSNATLEELRLTNSMILMTWE